MKWKAGRLSGHSFVLRIVFSFVLTILVAFIPLVIFIYSYGDSLTSGNLYNQLDVSLSDIQIRFTDSLAGYSQSLESFKNCNEIRRLAEGEPVSYDELYFACQVALAGREKGAIISVCDREGNVLFSSQTPEPDINFGERLQPGDTESIACSTDVRYYTNSGDIVIINLGREVKNREGAVALYIFLDITGSQFVRYADPALVNEVCLLDESSQMVSSLVHLEDYRAFDADWVFSSYTFTPDFRTPDNVLITHRSLPEYGFTLIGYLDISPYKESLNTFYILSSIVIVACFLLTIVVAFIMGSSLVKPLNHMISVMGEVEKGDLEARCPSFSVAEMDQLARRFNEMISQIAQLMEKNEMEKDRVREAERKLLEAQMNPHFLFNTLNVIRSLARSNGEKEIEDITIKLGRLLRYAVDNKSSSETVEESFLMVESYIGIQKVRFGEKLETSIQLDPRAKNVVIPKLIIQPLVENAIIHGLEPKLGQWKLAVSALVSQRDTLFITVEDNGVGFDEVPYQNMEAFASSNHTGMYNVYKRLELNYGANASFHVQSWVGKGSCITLDIPLQRER